MTCSVYSIEGTVPLSCQNLAGHCYSLLDTSLKYLGLSGCSRRLQSSPNSSSERHQLGDFFSHRCQAPQMTASDCYVRLWLPSASNEKLQTKTIKNSDNPVWNETFYFRIQREVENVLELAVCDEDPLTKDDMQFTVLFNIARVRPGERNYLLSILASVLDRICVCIINISSVIAVMATGGGLRAMSAMFGHLLALQKLNLLDCVTYLTGASGSTWTLADLYEHADWSQRSLEGPLRAVKAQVTKCKLNLMSMEHLKYYHKELAERAKAGHVSSFTTLWSLVQEMFLHGRVSKFMKLSDSCIQGVGFVSLFCTTVNIAYANSFVEWAEFSPYEVAIPKYGASIRSEYFDSEFFMGRRVKKLPESRICYLEGLWTNIFTRNLLDGLYWSSNANEFWERWAKDMVDIEKHSPEEDTTIIEPPSCLSGKLYEMFQDIITKRPLLGKSHNFLRGLEFHKDYVHQRKFIEWKDTVLDSFPNSLTPLQKYLCLIDVGYFINMSGAALFKPERNVDVIISLDYGLGNAFKQLEMTYKYCKIQKIPFPKVEISEEEAKNPKECYVFEDEEDPRAPIVIHFPLVNDTFKEFKAPGVKRSLSEMEEGKVNLENNCSPYYLIRLIYSPENFDKLVNLSKYNILNNRDLLFQALQNAVERKISSTTWNLPSHSGAGYA
uniref:Phospholipase A2 n=1 Tax=Pavo cristatus TaxID=9049 RepID=A0A8C9EL52_PAVCR